MDGSATTTDSITLRYPVTAWIGGLLILAIMTMVDAGIIVAGLFLIVGGHDPALLIILAVLAAFITGLCLYVGRDVFAKMSWRIDIGPQLICLRLPGCRSISHKLGPIEYCIKRSEISAIEHRLEGYSSFGLANLQCCYWIKLTAGQRIVLGETRALNTSLAQTFVADAAKVLAQQLGITQVEKAIAEGRGGILAIWFVHAPDWDAEPLDNIATKRLLRRVMLTRRIAVYAPIAVILLITAVAVLNG